MAEMDVLERRVATALLGYVDEVPDAVDAAAVARRVALEHPRGRGRRVGWRPTTPPRATWVLVLLAALLGALVGGVLVAGSQRERAAPAVAPPTLVPPAVVAPVVVAPPVVPVPVAPVAACPTGSNRDAPGPVDQARPPLSASTSLTLAFDRQAGRLVAVTDGAGWVETWIFDVCTNTWTRTQPNQEPPPLETDGLVYDVDSDLMIATSANHVWAYDRKANTWKEKEGLAPSGARLMFHDPVSGLVVAIEEHRDPDAAGPELWTYEVESDTWTPIHQANRPDPQLREYAYDPSVDRMIAHGPDGTWLFDLRTGTWSASKAVSPSFSYGWFGSRPISAYDEAAKRMVIIGQGRSVAYDAATDRWETLFEASPDEEPGTCGTRPECRDGRHVAYDAANGRLVAVGGTVNTGCTWREPDDVQAFGIANRSWVPLVPPTPVQNLRDLTAEAAPAADAPDRSPWIRAREVTLHGGAFFTRIPGVADQPWVSTPPAEPASIVDGLFLPDCQLWTDGAVWWEETTTDPSSRAWVEIDLGGTYLLDAAVVQADVNETYLLSYRDPQAGGWRPLWAVPLGDGGGGMATRPQAEDASVRKPFAQPVTTDALRFEATDGDAQYSVSEIAVFGRPAS